MLVLIFFAWCSRGNTKQETGEDNLEEAKYRIEILNLNNNLTSNNIYAYATNFYFSKGKQNVRILPHMKFKLAHKYCILN